MWLATWSLPESPSVTNSEAQKSEIKVFKACSVWYWAYYACVVPASCRGSRRPFCTPSSVQKDLSVREGNRVHLHSLLPRRIWAAWQYSQSKFCFLFLFYFFTTSPVTSVLVNSIMTKSAFILDMFMTILLKSSCFTIFFMWLIDGFLARLLDWLIDLLIDWFWGDM